MGAGARSPGWLERGVADLLAVYRAEHALEFTGLALANVYGPRQQPDRGVVAALLAAAEAGEAGTVPRRRPPDARLRSTSTTPSTPSCGPATRGSGLIVNVGTGVQTSGPGAAPGCAAARTPPPSAARPAEVDEAGPLRPVARAGPHPPRLGAVDDAWPTASAIDAPQATLERG